MSAAPAIPVDWLSEAERHVLGNVLGNSETAPRVFDQVADRLSSDDFLDGARGAIYAALALLAEEGQPISLPTLLRAIDGEVVDERRRTEVKAELGRCLDYALPRAATRTLAAWVSQMKAAARLRKARRLGAEIVNAAADGVQAARRIHEMLRQGHNG